MILLYLNGDSGLLILIGGENLRLLGGDHTVPWDKLGHHSTNGFNTQGKRCNIQKKDICSPIYQYKEPIRPQLKLKLMKL